MTPRHQIVSSEVKRRVEHETHDGGARNPFSGEDAVYGALMLGIGLGLGTHVRLVAGDTHVFEVQQ